MPDTTPNPLPECPREDCPATIDHVHNTENSDAYECPRQLGLPCPTHDHGGWRRSRCYAPRTPQPQPEDERVVAWHTISGHPFFRKCYDTEGPLLRSMLDRLDGLAEPQPQPAAVVLPTVEEASQAVSIAAHQGGSYSDYAQAVLDLIAARLPVWQPVEPGTVIKAGTRWRCESGEGATLRVEEETAALPYTCRASTCRYYIDPRTVPAEPEDPRVAVVVQWLYNESATANPEDDALDLLTRLDAARADQ